MKYTVIKYGDPMLRREASPISSVDDEIRQLAKDMLETMYAHRGIGLAAPQIGLTRSICVIDLPPEADVDDEGVRLHPDVKTPLVLINPVIESSLSQKVAAEEGCLSFPEISAPISRPAEVKVSFLDADGRPVTLQAKGLLARAIQHEIDHLHGVLFIDRMTPVKRIALSGRLKRLKKKTEQALRLK